MSTGTARVCGTVLTEHPTRVFFAIQSRRSFTTVSATVYTLSLAALVYSHPLGMIMVATLALAGLIGRQACFGSWRRWVMVHLAAATLVAPWITRYLDHAPEFLSGPLPLRFLLGTPIGFIGGNFAVLAGMASLIAWGLASLRQGKAPPEPPTTRDLIPERWLTPAFLLLWLIVPPSALYVYSRLFQPIFGPPRYTVSSAPAYLILVGLGLARLPAILRYPVGIGLSILAASELGPKVYDPELKADWRGFAAELASRSSGRLDDRANRAPAEPGWQRRRCRDGPVLPARRLRGDRARGGDPGETGARPG